MINSDTYISILFAILISAAFGALFTTLTQSISFLKKTWLIILDISITVLLLIYLRSIYLQKGLVNYVCKIYSMIKDYYIQFSTFIYNALSDKSDKYTDCMIYCTIAIYLYIAFYLLPFFIADKINKKIEIYSSINSILRRIVFALLEIVSHIISICICVYITFVLFNTSMLESTLTKLMLLYVTLISYFRTKLMYETYKIIRFRNNKTE